MSQGRAAHRAAELIDQLLRRGVAWDGYTVIAALAAAGLQLADTQAEDMVCSWIPTDLRPVPPEADTIIRTITLTRGDHSRGRSYWLEGLHGPRDAPY